jgi:uncharacterized membrane protein YidH (DUF202 family)
MIRGYSDHAANERTFLAWVRTGIAICRRRSALHPRSPIACGEEMHDVGGYGAELVPSAVLASAVVAYSIYLLG